MLFSRLKCINRYESIRRKTFGRFYRNLYSENITFGQTVYKMVKYFHHMKVIILKFQSKRIAT